MPEGGRCAALKLLVTLLKPSVQVSGKAKEKQIKKYNSCDQEKIHGPGFFCLVLSVVRFKYCTGWFYFG